MPPVLRAVLVLSCALSAIPAFTQEPGVDEENCKPSPLQLLRNAEAALKKSGYTNQAVASGLSGGVHENPQV
jgi:hypothetical protein